MTCSACGQENPNGAAFCGRCGGRLIAPVTTMPPYTPPPPQAGPGQVSLVCLAGPDYGKRLAVSETVATFGQYAPLHSDDPDAGAEHADFVVHKGFLYFRSHAGDPVFVNNVSQADGTLMPGQQLRMGRSYWQIETPPNGFASAPQAAPHGPGFLQSLGQRVGSVTGVAAAEGLNAREMFSSVLEKHSEEDVEEYFLVGTRTSTPPIGSVKGVWPRPWLFAKIFTLTFATYLLFVFMTEVLGNSNAIPGLMIIGGFGIPFTAVVFYFEMNVPRNVSFYQVFRALIFGGVLSLVFGLFGYTLFRGLLVSVQAGIAEEIGKVAALLLFAWNPRFRWTLNGLLLGGAIGAGFAGFETAGYALHALINALQITPEGTAVIVPAAVVHITVQRGVLALGGHVAWAALTGAALWKVKGDRPFTLSMLGDIRFLRVLGFVILLHTLWDAGIDFPIVRLLDATYLPWIGLTIVAWMAIFAFIQDGLKQVQIAQAERQSGTFSGG